jgi:hypothetical protein
LVPDLPGIFLIIHPPHLKKGVDPAAASLKDLSRKSTVAMILDGLAVQHKGGFTVLKTRSGTNHPQFDKEVTVELTPEGKLLVIRGKPAKRAQDAMSVIRREWGLKEPNKWKDNCARCGAHVVFFHNPRGAVEARRHLAPCGYACESVFTSSVNVPPHHSVNQCDLNGCPGGIANPYLTIREVSPDGDAYGRWGELVAKLPQGGIDDLLEWQPYVKVWV